MGNEINQISRPTSGLVKSISAWGAFLFGVHCISLSSSGFIPFSWVSSVWPGASIIGLLLIAMVMSAIHGFTFAGIGMAMPRPGADYVISSRVLSPLISYASSWTLVFFSSIVVGGLIAFISKGAIPALFHPISIIFNDSTFSEIANYSSSNFGSFIIGTICVIVTFMLMLLSNKWIVRILSFGFVLIILAWIVIYASLIGHTPQDFELAWNHFMSSTSEFGMFDKRVELAISSGMNYSTDRSTMTLAGLIMGFWIFYGYYIPTFFAGEVRRSDKSTVLVWASLLSIIVTGVIFILGSYFLQQMVDLKWIAAEGYIFNNPERVRDFVGHPVEGYPWITFYAAILNPNIYLVLFVAIAWIYTLINLAQTYFFYSSRVILAWSYDRVFPKFFTKVLPTSNSPIYCLIFIAILAEYGVFESSYGGPLSTQLSFAFFAVTTQIVSVLAITIFPYKFPEQFRLCPKFVTVRWFGIPRVSIFGIFTLIYLLWMIIASFLYPAVGVTNPINTLITLSIISVVGALIFLISKWTLKRREGLDINSIYRTPPN